ncbi:MAG: Flp pilus assembly protein CpaB [Candidatus Omnitrophica bacterium]|jgi:pilus assembly protein CpaB|nr:Flp pilus assembly protein CpaB [Candidatus Omnitrophota bacterium]
MDKRILNLVIGLGLGIIAIVVLHNHMQKREQLIQELIAKGRVIELVIARADIPREATITQDMVTLERTTSKSFQPGDLTSLESAIGKIAIVDILAGQHINSNMIRSLGAIKFLSQAIPKGMRAITIPVDKISAIEGLLKPDDRVDIVAVFNLPLEGENYATIVENIFQGVKVLAVDRNISSFRMAEQEAETVTLALMPEDIKLLTYILENSKVRLVLRPPLDDSAEEVGRAVVTLDTLLMRLGKYTTISERSTPNVIKVFKGTEKEEIFVESGEETKE